MEIAKWAILAYFAVGILFLIAFDMITKRIRRKLSGATLETMDKMAAYSMVIGHRSAVLATLMATWLFWPAIIVGALKGGTDGQKG